MSQLQPFYFAISAREANRNNYHTIWASNKIQAMIQANTEIETYSKFYSWFGEGNTFYAGYGAWD